MAKKEEEVKIPDINIIDKKGKKVKLSKIISQEDYWKVRRNDAFIISHKGVEKLAKTAGIKSHINTRFFIEVEPTHQNSMNNQVRAEMFCDSGKDAECVHGSDKNFFSTGEASRLNTGARGGSYLRTMAEKRAYDRGVLRHLGINDDVNIYSEDEAESFNQEEKKPIDEIIHKNKDIIQSILNCKTKEDFKKVAGELRDKKDLDNNESEYLRKIGNNRYIELFGAF